MGGGGGGGEEGWGGGIGDGIGDDLVIPDISVVGEFLSLLVVASWGEAKKGDLITLRQNLS